MNAAVKTGIILVKYKVFGSWYLVLFRAGRDYQSWSIQEYLYRFSIYLRVYYINPWVDQMGLYVDIEAKNDSILGPDLVGLTVAV